MWQPGGAYLDVLSAYTQRGRFPAPPAFIPQGLQTAIYFTAEDQIHKIEGVVTTETGTEEFGIAGCGGPGQPECAEDATASSGCPGGETASANCGKGVVVQGDANANGAAPDIGGRK